MFRLSILCLCARIVAIYFAAPGQAAPTPTAVDTAADPASTACEYIARSKEQIFRASDVKACLISVPFNAAVATRFISYYKDTLQFHSTLGYLKSPPSSYQQPATDLLGGLENIQIGIDNGAYKNQYTFEVALQKLIYSAHDDHLTLVGGILGVFQFGAGVYIASVSKDGTSLPEPYLVDDLINGQKNSSFIPSPISKINGRDAVQYLREFGAENALGALESHTEYNLLMSSPASDIQDFYSTWAGDANFLPPDDELDILLADGTHNGPFPFLALYNGPLETGPLSTGGDFYNFFVLGQYPASYSPYADWSDAEEGDSSATTEAVSSATEAPGASSTTEAEPEPTPNETESIPSSTPSSWYPNPAYPRTPDVSQKDLGTYGGGFVSGYFLKDISIAVLSIPSFKAREDSLNEFSSAVTEFLLASTKAGMKKVVIDLQQNYGGVSLLAFDTFRQFFPTIDPYGGSRLRAHGAANAMGTAMTKYFDTLSENDEDYYSLIANEWVSSKRLNANTNQTFATWSEEFGPHASNEDSFTTVQRFDLADSIFNTLSVGNPDDPFTVYGYGTRQANASQPYAAKDIVILSDSICASTCAMFMEMMHHDAGVKTVVAGGLPAYGPMQAPGLTRGARIYGVQDTLDTNIEYAEAVLEFFRDDNPHIMGNRTEELSMKVISAGINLRDQIRKDQEVPLQFVYEAADCRIFFTPKTFYNYTALWEYAADAIWGNSGKCVKDSTGYSTINNTKTVAPAQAVLPPANPPSAPKLGAIINGMLGTTELKTEPVSSDASVKDKIEGRLCKHDPKNPKKKACPPDYYCLPKYPKGCKNGVLETISACAKICPTNDDSYCPNDCQPFRQTADEKKFMIEPKLGYCEPNAPCKKKRPNVGTTSVGVERPPPGLRKV